MYPKANRLKKKRDIEIVFEHGRFVGGALCTAKVWKIDPQQFPKRGYTVDDCKIAVVVGKKVSAFAVKRNRLKRQMREVVRLLLKDKKLRTGFFVVLMAKPEMFGKEYSEIEKSVGEVLKKARVLK